MEKLPSYTPEQPEFCDYSAEQVLEVFTRQEILDLHDYYLDHANKPQTLFYQPLPPDFAPDKADFYHMLTDNRLSNRSTRAAQLFREDVAVKAIRQTLSQSLAHGEKAKAQRALRTCNVALACIAIFEQEVKENITEEAEHTETKPV